MGASRSGCQATVYGMCAGAKVMKKQKAKHWRGFPAENAANGKLDAVFSFTH